MTKNTKNDNHNMENLQRRLDGFSAEELRSLIQTWLQKGDMQEREYHSRLLFNIFLGRNANPISLLTVEEANEFLEAIAQGELTLQTEITYSRDSGESPVYDSMKVLDGFRKIPSIYYTVFLSQRVHQAAEQMQKWTLSQFSMTHLHSPNSAGIISASALLRQPVGKGLDAGFVLALFLAYADEDQMGLEWLLRVTKVQIQYLGEALQDESLWPEIRQDKERWSSFLLILLLWEYKNIRYIERKNWKELVKKLHEQMRTEDLTKLIHHTDSDMIWDIPVMMEKLLEDKDHSRLMEYARQCFQDENTFRESAPLIIKKGLESARKNHEDLDAFSLLGLYLQNPSRFTGFIPLFLAYMDHPASELYFLGLLDEAYDYDMAETLSGASLAAIQFFSSTLYRSSTALSRIKFSGPDSADGDRTFFMLMELYLDTEHAASYRQAFFDALASLLSIDARQIHDLMPETIGLSASQILETMMSKFETHSPAPQKNRRQVLKSFEKKLQKYLSNEWKDVSRYRETIKLIIDGYDWLCRQDFKPGTAGKEKLLKSLPDYTVKVLYE